MRRLLLITAVLGALAGPAWAQVETVSPGAERTAVVIYRDRPVDTAELMERALDPWERLDREGLALIVETRTIDVPAGDAVIRLRGVATGIVPQTATIAGLPVQVLERNTDFDLLSPGSLIERSVGEVVRVERTNRATGERTMHAAIIRSGAQGPVLEIDGRLEALNCSGLTQRILFERVPDGLTDQPVLSIRTRAPTAGRYTITLAYLATGLQWSADYVARLNPDGRTLDLTGWLTLANFGGTGFADAPVQVVAGTLNRDEDTVPVEAAEVVEQGGCWPMDTTSRGSPLAPPKLQIRDGSVVVVGFRAPAAEADNRVDLEEIIVTGSRIARQGELGDYKIYTLPEPTDVNARQTKQVRFLEQENVRYTRFYRAEIDAAADAAPRTPALLLRLRNEARDGLGMPLPGGGLSLIETQADRPLLAGQVRVEDRAVGQPFELQFGAAMGLSVTHALADTDWDYDEPTGWTRRTVVATITNDKAEAVEVEVVPTERDRKGFRIDRSDMRAVITDGGFPAFRVRVPANGARVLTYRFEYDNDY